MAFLFVSIPNTTSNVLLKRRKLEREWVDEKGNERERRNKNECLLSAGKTFLLFTWGWGYWRQSRQRNWNYLSLVLIHARTHTHSHILTHTHTHTHAHTHALTKTLAQITSTSLKVFAVKRKSHSLRMFKELFPANVQWETTFSHFWSQMAWIKAGDL